MNRFAPNMRAPLLALSALVALIAAACSDESGGGPVKAGDVTADNLIIYSNGMRTASGNQVLASSGGFVPAGPTVIYVVRDVSEAELKALKRDGVRIKPHTAYRLPAETALTLDALKAMKPIGGVDPALSNSEVKALFGQAPPPVSNDVPRPIVQNAGEGVPARPEKFTEETLKLKFARQRANERLAALLAQKAAFEADGVPMRADDLRRIEELEAEIDALDVQFAALVERDQQDQ